jgi:RNA polymerase sigma-70 factor (ECF subfamily)
VLSAVETQRLAQNVELFNAKDFERLRAVLADDVRLEVVGRFQTGGVEPVGGYFGNYRKVSAYRTRADVVERRSAVIVSDEAGGDYCILLSWDGDRVRAIRDYRYARHVLTESSSRTE